jgi:translation elongation factor EF-Tu-like GTPase
MSKRVVFVLNKYDLINDEELLSEYEKLLIQIFTDYLKEHKYKSLPEETIRKNIFVTSA